MSAVPAPASGDCCAEAGTGNKGAGNRGAGNKGAGNKGAGDRGAGDRGAVSSAVSTAMSVVRMCSPFEVRSAANFNARCPNGTRESPVGTGADLERSGWWYRG
ncbi:hypothetical protein GCM10010428_54480 [Actinosynnema pretiosum subsp. pretiosum]